MKNCKRRVFSLLLSLSMALTLLPAMQGEAQAANEDYKTWMQTDSRWSSLPLGSSGLTVYNAGCVVSAVAKLIIQAGLRNPNEFTIATFVNWLNSNGGFDSGGGYYWNRASSFGLTYEGRLSGFSYDASRGNQYSASSSNTALINAIKRGYHLVICIDNYLNGSDHWVAVDEEASLSSGIIYVMDTHFSSKVALSDRYANFSLVNVYSGGQTPTANGQNGDTTSPISTLAFNNINAPTSLNQGDYFSLRGTVTSNYNITSVKGEIMSTSGSVACSYTQYPNTTSFTILSSQLDYNMTFNKLSPGTYYLRYTATDSSGNSKTWQSGTFTVKGANATYYLDINGRLDGVSVNNIEGYGTVDVYIDGQLVADDVSDYWTAWPTGTRYMVIDISAASGCRYNGLHSGALFGTIGTENVSVVLDFSKEATPSYLAFHNTTAPTSLNQGDYFSLRGTVTSNYKITSIKGEIVSTSGLVACSYTQYPNTTSFTILNSQLDYNMTFNKLSQGTYYLRYTATDSSGKIQTWQSGTFTVKDANVQEGISNHIPGKPTLNISVSESSNPNTKFSWNSTQNSETYDVTIYQSNGAVVKKITGISGTNTSYNLSPGSYYAHVSAVNNTSGTWSDSSDYSFAIKSVTAQEHIHNLSTTAAKAATCTEAGNIEYWYCSDCGKYFSDANAKNEISREQTVIAALGHNYVNGKCTRDGAIDPAYSNPAEVHLPVKSTYRQGQFSDIAASQWFTDSVAAAVKFGLMKGDSESTFNPYGDVTLAEAIAMAARINSIYNTGSESFDQSVGNAWYQTYLDYALANGIIGSNYYNADVTRKATRAQFAEIFAKSLPENALAAIGSVADNAIPDVSTSASYAPYVYRLYRAGILTGGDALGTFSPQTYITRAEAAAIVSRMADSDNRAVITLQ